MRNPFARPDSASGSFLPQDYVSRKAELRANLLCLGLFGVVMFGVIGAFFVTNRQWLRVSQDQNTVSVQFQAEKAKIEQLDRLEQQKAEMMEKAEITTALIEKVPRSTLMSELISRMPEEITLLELSLVSKRIKDTGPTLPPAAKGPSAQNGTVHALGGAPTVAKATAMAKDPKSSEPEKVPPPKFEYTLHLVGVAHQNNTIADYLAGLKGCAFLDNVDLKYINPVTIDKLDLRKFEIFANIKKDADARDIEPVRDLNADGGVAGTDPAAGDPSQPPAVPERRLGSPVTGKEP
jgi:Tfp pilus assembly protein PilN